LESKEKMIRIQPITADVSGLTHNEIVEKFGEEIFGIQETEGKVLVQVGYIQIEEEKRMIKQEE